MARKWTRQPQGRVLVRGDPVLAGAQIMVGGYEYDYRTGARQISNVGTNARLAVRGEMAARHIGTTAGNYTSLGTPVLPVANCYAWVVRFFVDSIGVTTAFMSSKHDDAGAQSYALVMRVISSGNLQIVNKESSVEYSAGNDTIRANTWHTLAFRSGDYPAAVANNNRKSLWLDGRVLYLDASTLSEALNFQGEFAVAGATDSAATDGNNCGVSLSILMPNSASDADLLRLSRDPWSVFKPTSRDFWYTASAGAVQIGVPISTITAGAWTAVGAATLHEAIDETAASDSDYIVTTSASACEVRLTSLSAPVAGTRTVKYRISSSSSSNLQVDLVQGTTVVQTWSHTPAPATVTLYEQNVTGSVTDYTDLRLRFTAS